jgi:surface antigen
MSASAITDEMLVAFADGEADEATIEAVAAALDADEILAERLDLFVTTRQILKTELDPVAREAVPDRLTRFVMSGAPDAASEPAATAAAPRRRERWAALPMAAALAGIVAGGLGYWAGTTSPQGQGGTPTMASLVAADAELARALASTPDAERRNWRAAGQAGEIELRQSYRTERGFCRSFGLSEGKASSWGGLACRQGEGWATQVVVAEPRAADGAFRPASGSGGAIDAFLDGARAGDALDPAAVREQIAKGWR